MITQSKVVTLMPKVFHIAHNITLPKTAKQAPANEGQFQYMKDEYDSLTRNNT